MPCLGEVSTRKQASSRRSGSRFPQTARGNGSSLFASEFRLARVTRPWGRNRPWPSKNGIRGPGPLGVASLPAAFPARHSDARRKIADFGDPGLGHGPGGIRLYCVIAWRCDAIKLSGCHHTQMDGAGREVGTTQQKTPLSRGFWIFRDVPEQRIGARRGLANSNYIFDLIRKYCFDYSEIPLFVPQDHFRLKGSSPKAIRVHIALHCALHPACPLLYPAPLHQPIHLHRQATYHTQAPHKKMSPTTIG